jgi:hypothetical protein
MVHGSILERGVNCMTEAVKERPMPSGEGLTFEKVWAMFQETDRKFLGGIDEAI